MSDLTGHGPVEPEYFKQMNDLARGIDTIFNGDAKERTTGFVLLVFKFGDTARSNYISNANRADVIVSLKELVARFEGHTMKGGRA